MYRFRWIQKNVNVIRCPAALNSYSIEFLCIDFLRNQTKLFDLVWCLRLCSWSFLFLSHCTHSHTRTHPHAHTHTLLVDRSQSILKDRCVPRRGHWCLASASVNTLLVEDHGGGATSPEINLEHRSGEGFHVKSRWTWLIDLKKQACSAHEGLHRILKGDVLCILQPSRG